MKNLYRTIDPKSFKVLSFCIALLGDGILIAYIYTKFSKEDLFLKILGELWQAQGHTGQPSLSFAKELFQVWQNSLVLMLALVGGFHFIIYLLWQAKRVAPTKYIMLYFKAALVGFPLMGIFMLVSDPLWAMIFIALGGAYYFNIAGITFYKLENKTD